MATVKDLDTRLDEQDKAFAEFRGKVDTVISISRWLAALAAACLIGVVSQALSVSFAAGRIEGQVIQQGRSIDKLEERVGRIEKELERTAAKLDAVAENLKGLRDDLRQNRPAKP